jgi:hypothetical protein
LPTRINTVAPTSRPRRKVARLEYGSERRVFTEALVAEKPAASVEEQQTDAFPLVHLRA